MRDDFCAFILTHGRPDKVLTYRTLRRAGYTGKIFIVVDDEDKTRHQYMAEFGEQVLVFSKADIASRFDEADNFCDRRSIFYARNACFDLAKLVGCKYFIQLDDDYHEFQFRVDRNYDQAYFPIRKLDASFLKCWRTTNQYLLFPSLCRRAGIFLVTMAAMLRG